MDVDGLRPIDCRITISKTRLLPLLLARLRFSSYYAYIGAYSRLRYFKTEANINPGCAGRPATLIDFPMDTPNKQLAATTPTHCKPTQRRQL